MRKFLLINIMLLSLLLVSCSTSVVNNSKDLMSGIKDNSSEVIDIFDPNQKEFTRNSEIVEFSFKLFDDIFEKDNVLISPLSIVYALGMVANGADGKTLLEIENMLSSDTDSLNDYLKAYSQYLPSGKNYKVEVANSIWFKDDENIDVDKDFLQTNKNYYDASVYKSLFDEMTKNDINAWVNDKTDGLIDKILEEAPSVNTVMYLINALSFDAEWEDVYKESQIFDGEFILENNDKKTVEFMMAKEDYYIENEYMTGFKKPYKDNKYDFVAFLPKEDITMPELINSFNQKNVIDFENDFTEQEVLTQIPKFTTEYSTLLNKNLINLEMIDAFDDQSADFSKMVKVSNENVFINKIIHKTKLTLDERGTKAGAVTAVEMDATGAPIEIKEVILNRPFFYMIVDRSQNIPLFIGVLTDIN